MARDILLTVVALHPRNALIHFNLGRYSAQLGDLKDAKERVSKAVSLDKSLRLAALDDPDLEPLWAEFSADWPG